MSTSAPSAGRKLRVGKRAYLWLLAGLLPALFAARHEAVLGTLAIDALLLTLFLFDALRLWQTELRVERALASRLRVGVPTTATLEIHNESSLVLRVRLRDDLPESLLSSSETQRLVLPARSRELVRSEITPTARGTESVGRVSLRIESRLGLAAVHLSAGPTQEVRVLPPLGLDAATHRARRDELGNLAQKLKRSAQGNELESLREYVNQDPLRAIDWKATARRQRPVTRLYQPERSQTLWLVLDASRTMTQPVGETSAVSADGAGVVIPKSRFDVAVEAALALADAALYAGDQVGLIVYADSCLCLVPKGRGRRHTLRLVDALSEVRARPVHFAVRSLLTDLERHARKRSLITLFTDLENETHGAAVCEHAPMLTRRHLAVCVSLQDVLVRKRAAVVPTTPAEVFHKAAAIDVLSERERLERSLQKRGVAVLEADVRGLVPKLLDHYLQVKLAARL